MTNNKVKILLIEDDEFDALALSTILRDMDAEVDVATDGMKGLKAIEALNPDMVLLDLSLPVMNGTDILKELKNKESDSKVVVLTGYYERRKEVYDVQYPHLLNILFKPIDEQTLEPLVKFMQWQKGEHIER